MASFQKKQGSETNITLPSIGISTRVERSLKLRCPASKLIDKAGSIPDGQMIHFDAE